MSSKFLNSIPIVVVVAVSGAALFHQWQQVQAARPAYDRDSVAAISSQGIVNGAKNIESSQTENWQLVRVLSGDAILAKQGMREEKIRLCGVDSPDQAQPLGDRSTAYLQNLLSERDGELGIIPVERDRDGRLVAEVFLLGNPEKFVQEEMLKSGMTYVYPQYVDRCWNGTTMRAAEAIGQEQKAGVWAGDYQKPWDYRKHSSREDSGENLRVT